MTPQPEAIAFLLDEDDLRHILLDWPEMLRLAVCVDREGGCVMLVYHREEDSHILGRISEAIQQPVGAFCVVPERTGCPTRKMLFSEEQRLLSLVAETEGLAESAADYAINYAFAAEEGLDAQLMTTGAAGAAATPRARAEPAPERPEPVPMPTARKAQPGPRRFGWRKAPAPIAEAPEKGAPEGFRRLNQEERRHGLFVGGVLSVTRSGRVEIAIGRATAEGRAVEVDEVFFRDDLLCFAILGTALAGLERLPQRLTFDTGLFPAAMVSILDQASQAVRITASGRHIYVSLSPVRAPAFAAPLRAEPREAIAPRKPRRRVLRAGLGGGVAALTLLVVLHTGLSGAFGSLDAQTTDGALRAQIFGSTGSKP